MKELKEYLEKNEKKIVTDAYKIALAKQDIALGLIDVIKEIIKKESPKEFSNERIADLVFKKVKEIPNEKIQEYLKSNKEKKYIIRLKIEKEIMSKIKNKKNN